MVDSPMYDRLMRLVAALESAEALVASDGEHNAIVCGLNEANNSTHHYVRTKGLLVKRVMRSMRGQTQR